MVSYLIAIGLYLRHQFRVPPRALADEKERGFGLVALQDFEHLGSEVRVWSVVKRQRDQWKVGPDSVDEVRRNPLDYWEG
jgi:hypothetical protein